MKRIQIFILLTIFNLQIAAKKERTAEHKGIRWYIFSKKTSMQKIRSFQISGNDKIRRVCKYVSTWDCELCDFFAYQMRYGKICYEKLLYPKGKNGHDIMRLINNVNSLLEVSLHRNPITYGHPWTMLSVRFWKLSVEINVFGHP